MKNVCAIFFPLLEVTSLKKTCTCKGFKSRRRVYPYKKGVCVGGGVSHAKGGGTKGFVVVLTQELKF